MERHERKNLLISSEKTSDLIFKVIQKKTVMQQKRTAVVSPIIQCIQIAPKSTKIKARIMLQFPTTYLESDL
ncbi:hypothetical protein ACJMK2_043091 [Sinanodonta woodiana]|uniref:Uncharacterized protein n=1 Tax=Sinanodonta woodiana TaxID=1069815 RepID=A0ABD3VVU3_SINWO